MRKAIIEIIDHGSGNCGPLRAALTSVGYRVNIKSERGGTRSADVLVLPGVGNFGFGMRTLRERGLDQYICDWASSGSPLIGICLGMQMLFDSSLESDNDPGLGLISGHGMKLSKDKFHIGWNYTRFIGQTQLSGDYFYNHSYHVNTSEKNITSRVEFGGEKIVSSVRQGNIFGFQFHPEKSQDQGLSLLQTTLKEILDA
jgi:imidazole glycerol-phosphate synthase subunit HisH